MWYGLEYKQQIAPDYREELFSYFAIVISEKCSSRFNVIIREYGKEGWAFFHQDMYILRVWCGIINILPGHFSSTAHKLYLSCL